MPVAQAAVAMVHACGAEESILLIRRTERSDDPWSGHWSFPGGRCDAGDADLIDTALRELAEECGIRLGRDRLEAAFEPRPAGRRMPQALLVAPFLFCVEDEMPAVPDPREAVEALWAPLKVLRDPARHALLPVPGMPADQLFPAVELNGVPLWGFTYRLLKEWLQFR